jgi:fumarate reductase subunit D
MARRRTIEPFLWTLFSAGGVVAALLLPIHVFLFAFAYPLGWAEPPTYERLAGLMRSPLAKIYVIALCMFPLFHAAHRLRFTLYDGLQIKHLNELINPLCYGVAVVGSILATWWVFRFF